MVKLTFFPKFDSILVVVENSLKKLSVCANFWRVVRIQTNNDYFRFMGILPLIRQVLNREYGIQFLRWMPIIFSHNLTLVSKRWRPPAQGNLLLCIRVVQPAIQMGHAGVVGKYQDAV